MRLDGVYSSVPGTSSFQMSPGISSSTGPGRPLLRLRERTAQTPARWQRRVLICSHDLVMCWKFIAALKPGFTHACPREEPAGITTIGTPSE